MRSPHSRLINKAALASALLAAGFAAPPAHAQTPTELDLGQFGNAGLSGSAVINVSGTMASGTYQFLVNGSPTPLDPVLTTYEYLTENGSSTATIGSGGSVTVGLYVPDTSLLSVTGGFLPNVQAHGSSTVNISGGTLGGFNTFDNGTINLFGTGLTETFAGAGPNYTLYAITGTLQDGTLIDCDYVDFGGKLTFNSPAAVPEVSSVISLGALLALGLGGVALSARRRKIEAAG